MYKHIQSTLFLQWFFSEYIHTGDTFSFLFEVISKLPEVSLGIHRPATGQFINQERLTLWQRSNKANTAWHVWLKAIFTLSTGHTSLHCEPVKSSTLSLEKVCLNWHPSYPHFFPGVRLHWPLHSSAPTPGSGAAKQSRRQAHVPPAESPHHGFSTALHFIYPTRLCPGLSPGSPILPGAQSLTRGCSQCHETLPRTESMKSGGG